MRGDRVEVLEGRTALRTDLTGMRAVLTRMRLRRIPRSMRRRRPNIPRVIHDPRSIRRHSVTRRMRGRRRAGLPRAAVRNRNGMKNSRTLRRAKRNLRSSSSRRAGNTSLRWEAL
jgi:hypothetical protein